MTLQVRTVRVDEDGHYTLDGFRLGAAGDEGNDAVMLAELELDGTIGSDALEITQSEDVIATVSGVNYAVGFATVRRDNRLDDKLVIVGIPTDYTPGDNEAAADALAEDKAARKEASRRS